MASNITGCESGDGRREAGGESGEGPQRFLPILVSATFAVARGAGVSPALPISRASRARARRPRHASVEGYSPNNLSAVPPMIMRRSVSLIASVSITCW